MHQRNILNMLQNQKSITSVKPISALGCGQLARTCFLASCTFLFILVFSAQGRSHSHVACSSIPLYNMATRNLTRNFVETRNAAKANRHLRGSRDDKDESSDSGLLVKNNF